MVQNVPLLKSDITGTPTLRLELGSGQPLSLTRANVYVKAPLNGMKQVALDDVPLVFVGYGVTAPERNWDDFKDVDVRGKLIVLFVNDPDFEAVRAISAARRWTYYGRWTYKYESCPAWRRRQPDHPRNRARLLRLADGQEFEHQHPGSTSSPTIRPRPTPRSRRGSSATSPAAFSPPRE